MLRMAGRDAGFLLGNKRVKPGRLQICTVLQSSSLHQGSIQLERQCPPPPPPANVFQERFCRGPGRSSVVGYRAYRSPSPSASLHSSSPSDAENDEAQTLL